MLLSICSKCIFIQLEDAVNKLKNCKCKSWNKLDLILNWMTTNKRCAIFFLFSFYFLSILFLFSIWVESKGEWNETKRMQKQIKYDKKLTEISYSMIWNWASIKLTTNKTQYKQNWMHSKYKHNNHGYHIWNNKICFTLKLTFSNW